MEWYAVYTIRNAEQKLRNFFDSYCEIKGLEYESFLPMTKEVRYWSDRKKTVSVPLFKNYLFLKHDENGFSSVKKMPGFTDYVRFGNYPETVPDSQIQLIREVIAMEESVSCKSTGMIKGEKVRIKSGPLADLEGILVKDQENSKVSIEIKSLNQSMLVTVPLSNIVKV